MTTRQSTGQAAEHDTAAFGVDDPWLAEPPKRSRLRLVLLILLAAAVVFYGGVEVQKRYGTAGSATDTAAGPAAGGFTPPDGASFPGGGQLPGGGTGDENGTGDQGAGSSDTDTDTVIGTVVSLKGDKLVVEDFGGKKHTITLGANVRVVLKTAGNTSDLKAGATVQVTDSTITVR
jgi:hypothetical protein